MNHTENVITIIAQGMIQQIICMGTWRAVFFYNLIIYEIFIGSV